MLKKTRALCVRGAGQNLDMQNQNKKFDTVRFKTFREFSVKEKVRRNLFQNSVSLTNYKKSLPALDIHVISIIRGGLLGDVTGIRRSNNPTDCLKIEQKVDKLEYVDHLYYVLYDFVGTPPAIRNIKGGGATDRQSYWFRTYGHPELAKIITPFYKYDAELEKLVKIIPNDIDKWFNECVLAYWYMDDGSKTGNSYYINTQSYTLDDQQKLQKALNKLKIKASIKNDKISKGKILYRLKIDTESNNTFYALVKPYVLPIFDYKL
jgi:hypothetical protein